MYALNAPHHVHLDDPEIAVHAIAGLVRQCSDT
jgi:hypothetical protein